MTATADCRVACGFSQWRIGISSLRAKRSNPVFGVAATADCRVACGFSQWA